MPDRHGPMRTGRFKVEIDDVEVAGFRTVELPRRYTELDEYREEGESDARKQLWGQPEFDDLKMERGVAPGGTELFDWRTAVEEGKVDDGRKEISVTLMDEEGESQIRWSFDAAWPKEYHPPELDATADDEVATESITVAFDSMIREEVQSG
ncbi:MAG: phage tail protein [Haloferacaceae archaeon]